MAAWLDVVSDGEGWSLIDTGRLREIVQDMAHPNSQFPFLILFAGNPSRVRALRTLFPRNNVTRKGPGGFVRLHISTVTAQKEQPVMFAETDIFTQNGMGDTVSSRYRFKNLRRFHIPVPDKGASVEEVKRKIIASKILPWTKVICFFVSSSSEMENVQRLLQGSHRSLTVGDQPLPENIHVIIVLTEGDADNPESNAYCSNMKDESFPNQTILDLRHHTGMSELVIFEPLRRLIMDQLYERDSIEQIGQNANFSATHLYTLWNADLQLQENWQKEVDLDCLQIARGNFPENSGLSNCLVEFKKIMDRLRCPDSETHQFIASALLMNAYPPEMHKFPPELVFKSMYEKHCLVAYPTLESTDFTKGVMREFSREFTKLGPHNSSATLRLKSLAQFHAQWSDLWSTKACLVCLCRPPEHMMPCHHAICETCTTLFGERSAKAEYHKLISECPICAAPCKLTIRQLPPTKQPVIFSLDGGGVRGVIQLGLLRELERRLGGIPLAEVADFCGGTSVGALSNIDMILNGSTAELSFSRFPALARAVFKSSYSSHRKFPGSRGIELIILATKMLTGGQYDSENLVAVLKEAVGSKRRIFDVSTTETAGCKVAIITSRASDGKACVFGNYRGQSQRTENSAYEFLLPEDEKHNPFLWEAAECSVAAPFFFKTKFLPGFGQLQDGGVRANNPLAIALKESNKIWPKAKKNDLVLSIGTGVSLPDCYTVPDTSNVFRDGSIPRLIRATLSSPCMDGEQGFAEALNYLPSDTKSDIFRLNQPVDGPLPRLDDVGKMNSMLDLKYSVPDDLVRKILASAFFFFELDVEPMKRDDGFLCQGSILCSRGDINIILKQALLEMPNAHFQTARGQYLGGINENDGCPSCGYFRKAVRFTVTNLDEMASIEIANTQFCHEIGGFPKSAQELLIEQQSHAQFGRADHKVDQWPPSRACYCSQATKRHIKFVEPSLGQKRRRL